MMALAAWLGGGFIPCQAGSEKAEAAPPAANPDTNDDSGQPWFSWWGPAKPSTNAPLLSKPGEPPAKTDAVKEAAPAKGVPAQPASGVQPKAAAAAPARGTPAKPEATNPPAKSVKTKPAAKAAKPEAGGASSKGWFSWWGPTQQAGAATNKPVAAAKPEPKPEPKSSSGRGRWWWLGGSASATGETAAAAASGAAMTPEAKAQAEARKRADAGELSPWRFSAGLLQRRIGRTSVKTADSYSRREVIPNKGANGHWHGGNVGSASGFDDREYDNGYVMMDDWTVLDGGTTVWGFEHGGQVHDGYVEFNALTGVEESFHRTTVLTESDWEQSSDREWGGLVAVDWLFYRRDWFALGLGLSASRASFSSSGSGTTFQDSQSWKTYQTSVADRYSLAGTGVTPGVPPTSWTVDQPGPVIDNIPAQRHTSRQMVDSGRYDAFNAMAQKLSMDLYTLSVGLSLGFDWWRLHAAGLAGPTVNYVDADGTYDETLYASANGGEPSVLNTWRATRAEAEFMTGFYLQAGLFLDVVAGLQLGVFGRYDWLEEYLGTVGPSRYAVDPAGGSYGASVGVSF